MCMYVYANAVGEYGASWLYSGERAQALARDIQAAGGIITASDLESAEVRLGGLKEGMKREDGRAPCPRAG